MKNFVVVANRTGGQGKTLLAHLLSVSVAADRVVMCADTVDESAKVSKLGRMIPGVVEIGAGPSAAEVSDDAQAAYSYWDVIGEKLLAEEGQTVILDVGANVVDRIFEWGVVTGFKDVLGDSVQSSLVIPIVARPKSLSDAADVIREAIRFGSDGGIDFSSIVLVRNHWQGSFVSVESSDEYKDLQKAVGQKSSGQKLTIVDLPRCDSDVLKALEERHISISDIEGMQFSDVSELFSWPKMKAARALKQFNEWVETCRGVLVGNVLDVEVSSRLGASGESLKAVVPE